MQTPPGWYRDPTNAAFDRWWDGTAWTHSMRATAVPGTAAVPGAAAPSAGASRTRTIAAVAGVVVVLVILIVSLAALRNGGDDAALTGTTRQQPAPVPSGGTDFLDNNGAYSIHIADAWEQAPFDAGAAWYTGTGDRTFRDNIVIIVEDLPTNLSLDTYVDVGMRSADRRGVHFDEKSRTPVVLSDGGDALVIDSTSLQQGFELGHRLVVAVHDRVAVTVTFTSERDRFPDAVAAVDQYLRTLSVR